MDDIHRSERERRASFDALYGNPTRALPLGTLRLVVDGPDIGRVVLVPPDIAEVRVYASHYDVQVYFDGAEVDPDEG